MSKTHPTRGPRWDSLLARNIRELFKYPTERSVNRWCQDHNLIQATINRIANGTRDATTAIVEEIASKTGYAAWQLMLPDFDPRRMPAMMDPAVMHAAAVFASITDPTKRAAADAMLQALAPVAPAPSEHDTIAAPTVNAEKRRA
jgi:hypothetical protein